MISYKRRCIFVHIPRTGGSSIERVVWGRERFRTQEQFWMGYVKPYFNKYQTGGMQHLLAPQIQQEVGEEVFNNFFKFALVRNPWDKAVSQFHYIQKRQDLLDWIGMSDNDSFERYLQLTQKKLHVQWEHQHKFLFNESGKQMVDYVGRFENYEESVYHILDHLGFRTRLFNIRLRKIPHVSKSDRADYRSYYSDVARELVSTWYRKDIELFGYKFE